jgi:acyl-CoA synthetase (AMP-forming)/AMP-acid ligase II
MLARALTVAAARAPAAEAIADGPRRATYQAFEARVNRVAASLARLGLARGEHVVILLKNREEHVALYWACQKLGLVATPLNWRFAAEEVRFCVDDAEGVAVVFEAASAAAVSAARAQLPRVRRWIYAGAGAPPDTLDKDFVRRWVAERCDPYKDPIPEIPAEVILQAAATYVGVYEKLTGREFALPDLSVPPLARVRANLTKYFDQAA